jgi:hypothetical protein
MVNPTRTGTLAACHLTLQANTGTQAFDLITPVGLSLTDGACSSSMTLTLLPDPSP